MTGRSRWLSYFIKIVRVYSRMDTLAKYFSKNGCNKISYIHSICIRLSKRYETYQKLPKRYTPIASVCDTEAFLSVRKKLHLWRRSRFYPADGKTYGKGNGIRRNDRGSHGSSRKDRYDQSSQRADDWQDCWHHCYHLEAFADPHWRERGENDQRWYQ